MEDIIRDGSKESFEYWANAPLGRVRFSAEADATAVEIRGLSGILQTEPVITRTWEEEPTGFMTGTTAIQRSEQRRLPIEILWKAYRFTTHLLAERGFEIEEIEEQEWEI